MEEPNRDHPQPLSQKAEKLSGQPDFTTEKSGSIEESGRFGLKGRSLDHFSQTQRPATCLPLRCVCLHGKESQEQWVECLWHGSGLNAEDIHTLLSSPTDWALFRQHVALLGICQSNVQLLRFPLQFLCRLAGRAFSATWIEAPCPKAGAERCPK